MKTYSKPDKILIQQTILRYERKMIKNIEKTQNLNKRNDYWKFTVSVTEDGRGIEFSPLVIFALSLLIFYPPYTLYILIFAYGVLQTDNVQRILKPYMDHIGSCLSYGVSSIQNVLASFIDNIKNLVESSYENSGETENESEEEEEEEPVEEEEESEEEEDIEGIAGVSDKDYNEHVHDSELADDEDEGLGDDGHEGLGDDGHDENKNNFQDLENEVVHFAPLETSDTLQSNDTNEQENSPNLFSHTLKDVHDLHDAHDPTFDTPETGSHSYNL